jgi:hypothetical protein
MKDFRFYDVFDLEERIIEEPRVFYRPKEILDMFPIAMGNLYRVINDGQIARYDADGNPCTDKSKPIHVKIDEVERYFRIRKRNKRL